MPDPNHTVCQCAHCRIRGLMGPLMIITVGVLFLIARVHPLQLRGSLAGALDRGRHCAHGAVSGFQRGSYRLVRRA